MNAGLQGDQPAGKPGKVMEFDVGQGKVGEKSGKLWFACCVLLQLK